MLFVCRKRCIMPLVNPPELIRNVMLLVAHRHQTDKQRPDPEVPWGRSVLGLIFGEVAVLVMVGSGTANDMQA